MPTNKPLPNDASEDRIAYRLAANRRAEMLTHALVAAIFVAALAMSVLL